jgi:membrane protein implicated in regulation of membrane protease activity
LELENELLYASSLVASLQEINKFIKGGEYKRLKEHMKSYDRHLIKFKRDFYLLTIYAGKDYQSTKPIQVDEEKIDDKHDTATIIAELETLLANLSIPQYRWGRYLNSKLTPYELLCQLHADLEIKANIQINTIIELVEKRKVRNKKIYYYGGGLAALILLTIATIPPILTGVLELAKFIMATTIAFPIGRILFTLASSGYYAYQNHFDKKRSLFNRLRDNSFLLFNTALNVSGSLIWLASATMVVPVASAALFLLSSLMDVVKEIFATVQNYSLYKNYQDKNHSLFVKQDLHDQQEQARHQIGYLKHRNAAIINTVAAVLLLAIMVAWQFIPGGIFVTIGSIAAIGIVYQTQKMVLKRNKKTMRDELQGELRHLEQEYANNNVDILDNDNTLNAENSLALEETAEVEYSTTAGVLNKLRVEERETASFRDSVEQLSTTPTHSTEDVSSINYSVASKVSFFKHLIKEQSGVAKEKQESEEADVQEWSKTLYCIEH